MEKEGEMGWGWKDRRVSIYGAFSSYEDTSPIGLRPHFWPHLSLITISLEVLYSKYSHMGGGGEGFNIQILEGHSSVHNKW